MRAPHAARLPAATSTRDGLRLQHLVDGARRRRLASLVRAAACAVRRARRAPRREPSPPRRSPPGRARAHEPRHDRQPVGARPGPRRRRAARWPPPPRSGSGASSGSVERHLEHVEHRDARAALGRRAGPRPRAPPPTRRADDRARRSSGTRRSATARAPGPARGRSRVSGSRTQHAPVDRVGDEADGEPAEPGPARRRPPATTMTSQATAVARPPTTAKSGQSTPPSRRLGRARYSGSSVAPAVAQRRSRRRGRS